MNRLGYGCLALASLVAISTPGCASKANQNDPQAVISAAPPPKPAPGTPVANAGPVGTPQGRPRTLIQNAIHNRPAKPTGKNPSLVKKTNAAP